jgi:hypothetical protein
MDLAIEHADPWLRAAEVFLVRRHRGRCHSLTMRQLRDFGL